MVPVEQVVSAIRIIIHILELNLFLSNNFPLANDVPLEQVVPLNLAVPLNLYLHCCSMQINWTLSGHLRFFFSSQQEYGKYMSNVTLNYPDGTLVSIKHWFYWNHKPKVNLAA